MHLHLIIVSVMNLHDGKRLISSEIGESFERSMAASRCWCIGIVSKNCLFIIVKVERALKEISGTYVDGARGGSVS